MVLLATGQAKKASGLKQLISFGCQDWIFNWTLFSLADSEPRLQNPQRSFQLLDSRGLSPFFCAQPANLEFELVALPLHVRELVRFRAGRR